MSGETEHYRKTRDKINAVSPSFCMAKWLQVTLHLQNGHTHSCHHPVTHHIPPEEIAADPSALHNTKFKMEQRKKMLEGERPAECSYCWKVEDLPGDHFSDRTMKSSDYWSLPSLETVSQMPWDRPINPTYLEVSFSNACNFKCSYCSPVHSSSWMAEIKEGGSYPTSQKLHDLSWIRDQKKLPIHHTEHNPYVEAFWKWWPDLVKDLKVFRITGGEPLMEPNTFKVLEHFRDNPNPDIELHINTNACVPEKLINRFIDLAQDLTTNNKVKLIWLYTSVDTAGEAAEYIRNGLNYEQWKLNVDRLMFSLPTTKVTVMCTSNLLSITRFRELLEDLLVLKLRHINDQRKVPITLDMSILHWPFHQAVNILPKGYDQFMQSSLDFMLLNQEGKNGNDYYHGFHEFEIIKLRRFIEYMTESAEVSDKLDDFRSDFFVFVQEHDRRRGTNFLATFPELADFYQMCRRINRKRIDLTVL